MKDMGKVMAALREKAQGRADFATIGEQVKARLAGKVSRRPDTEPPTTNLRGPSTTNPFQEAGPRLVSGRIPQDFIDDLVQRADIVEVVGSRVPLTKAGREYKARCPFHSEKTPSFWVSPQKGFYHCFGCGAHGTALGFLMEYERLEFPVAVEELARSVGVEVPRTDSAERVSVEPLYAMLDKAAQLYRQALRDHADTGRIPEAARPRRRNRARVRHRLRAAGLGHPAGRLRRQRG